MKHRIGYHVLAWLALAGTSVSVVNADPPEPCVTIPSFLCSAIPYLGSNESWIPPSFDWAPNRLPAALISLRIGEYCSGEEGNYRGVQSWWYDQDDCTSFDGDETEVIDNLRDRITDAYNSGYRRIILYMPAGSVIGQDVASSQWWSMPEWRRDAITCLISNWLLENPDTQFEVYGAFPTNDPESLCMEANAFYTCTTGVATCPTDLDPSAGQMYYPCAGASSAYPPSGFLQAEVCAFHRNVHPWQHLGITRYWLDYAFQFSENFVEFPYCPLYAPGTDEPHFLGAEAFPMIFDNSDPTEVDFSLAALCPAIMFPGHIAVEDDDKSWDASAYAASTELMVVVDWSDGDDYFNITHMFHVLAWTQRGFVLAAQASQNALVPPQFTEYMKRVYDFGILANRRDFNGDGSVNSTDSSDFNAMYTVYNGRSNCNWVHGDMDQDHDVDSHDYLLFNLWHNTINPTLVAVNLGNANPYNALTKP
jgi:hypothetical protein